MKRTSIVAAAVVLAASGARAQDLQAPDSQRRPPDTRPVTTSMSREKMDRIYNIRQLEVLFTIAVKTGASSLASRMQAADPSSLFVTSNARSRGTELEGYGVFFDVDVPTMLQSVLWSAQVRQEQLQDLYRARAMANDPKLPESIRRVAGYQARSLEKVLGLQMAPPLLADAQQVPPPGTVAAATADNVIPAASGSRAVAQTGGVPAEAAVPVAPVPPILDPRSPNELYTEAIKEKLIDAMLSHGGALRLDDKEWLVIAARAVNDSTPGQLDDSASILIRIKGEDLNAYIMKKLTKDEVIKKIEVKEG